MRFETHQMLSVSQDSDAVTEEKLKKLKLGVKIASHQMNASTVVAMLASLVFGALAASLIMVVVPRDEMCVVILYQSRRQERQASSTRAETQVLGQNVVTLRAQVSNRGGPSLKLIVDCS